MKFITLLFGILLLSGCSKTEDDTRLSCTSDCTTIGGKFITAGDIPVSGIEVALAYHIPGGELGGSYTRKIVRIVSDDNGLFSKSFYIKDNELGDGIKGYFEVDVDDRRIDPNRFIRSTNLKSTTPMGFTIFSITRRDTAIYNLFYVPTKAFIKVHLNDFHPQQADDFFEVQTLYPFGRAVEDNAFLGSRYSTGFSGYGNFRAKQINNLLTVFVAEAEKNIVRVAKRKNGETTYEDYPIFVPRNNTIELTFNY